MSDASVLTLAVRDISGEVRAAMTTVLRACGAPVPSAISPLIAYTTPLPSLHLRIAGYPGILRSGTGFALYSADGWVQN